MMRAVATVLVADDLSLVRMLCRRYLEAAGYRVIEARDGREALTSYHEHRPAAVLLDVLMPEMDGLAVLRAIKALDPSARVAMLTAENERNRVTGALDLGAKDYIVKPFQPDRVVRAVERLIGPPTAL